MSFAGAVYDISGICSSLRATMGQHDSMPLVLVETDVDEDV